MCHTTTGFVPPTHDPGHVASNPPSPVSDPAPIPVPAPAPIPFPASIPPVSAQRPASAPDIPAPTPAPAPASPQPPPPLDSTITAELPAADQATLQTTGLQFQLDPVTRHHKIRAAAQVPMDTAQRTIEAINALLAGSCSANAFAYYAPADEGWLTISALAATPGFMHGPQRIIIIAPTR